MTLHIERSVLPRFLGHSLLFFVILMAGLWLGYHYWHGEYGRYELNKLKEAIDNQIKVNEEQSLKLQRLRADVTDLKSGLVAIEEHARTDLGLIKQGELFVQMAQVSTTYNAEPVVENEPDAEEVLQIMTDESPNVETVNEESP